MNKKILIGLAAVAMLGACAERAPDNAMTENAVVMNGTDGNTVVVDEDPRYDNGEHK